MLRFSTLIRAVMLCALAIPSRDAAAQDNYGTVWLSLNPTLKGMYVLGISQGTLLAEFEIRSVLADTVLRRAWLNPTPDVKFVPFDSMIVKVLKPYGDVANNKSAETIAGIMTTLYADPANGCIPMHFAARIAVQRYNGSPPEIEQRDLASYRRTFAPVCPR